MIPAVFAVWFMAMPMGYLAGDVFAENNTRDPDMKKALPWAAALLPPLGALLAFVVMTQATLKTKDGDNK